MIQRTLDPRTSILGSAATGARWSANKKTPTVSGHDLRYSLIYRIKSKAYEIRAVQRGLFTLDISNVFGLNSIEMTGTLTTPKALQMLLLAAVLCFAMVYSQIVHAAVPSELAVGTSVEAGSVLDESASAAGHEHASTSQSGDVKHDHGSGKPDGKCSTHCPSVFGMGDAFVVSLRLRAPADPISVERRIEGRSVAADRRPPRS